MLMRPTVSSSLMRRKSGPVFSYVDESDPYPSVFSVSDCSRSHQQIWLFKPSMRLSYAIPTQYVLAKSASIRAGKVLFKILDTAVAYSDLDGYGIFDVLCYHHSESHGIPIGS